MVSYSHDIPKADDFETSALNGETTIGAEHATDLGKPRVAARRQQRVIQIGTRSPCTRSRITTREIDGTVTL